METIPEEFKIVVADDSPIYRKLVEDTLAHEQYAVVSAKNGSEANPTACPNTPTGTCINRFA